MRPLHAHVNLIPVNKVEEREYKKGTNSEIRAFCKALEDLGINATVRRELGSDISASCGQLRKKTIKVATIYINPYCEEMPKVAPKNFTLI